MKKNLITKTLFLAMGLCVASGITATLVSTNKSAIAVHALESIDVDVVAIETGHVSDSDTWFSLKGEDKYYYSFSLKANPLESGKAYTFSDMFVEDTYRMNSDFSDLFYASDASFLLKANGDIEASMTAGGTKFNLQYTAPVSKKISDILPDDFPIMSGSTIPANAWSNENGAQLFVMNSKLVFAGTGTCNTDIKNPVVVDGTNYTYSFGGNDQKIVTFYMENNQLASIGLTGNSDYQTYGLYTAPHIHNFSYVANGNVITATCGEGCIEGWDENPLTLTLVSPTNLVYDGDEKNVTFATGEADAWEAAGLELPDITYLIKESGATEYSSFSEIPTNAGDFMAKIAVDGKEAKLQFTIEKATPYIKTLPAPSDINLGEKLSTSTLGGGYVQVSETDTTEVPGLFEWTEPNTTPSLADSDVTLYNVTFTPNDDNFNTISCQVTIRINHTHNPTMVNGQAPTETTSGWKDYYECSCGALFEDEIGSTPIDNLTTWKAEGGNGYIAPLGHVLADIWSFDATYHWHQCTNDGCDYIADKGEHDYKYLDSPKKPTCTENGTDRYRCECGAIITKASDPLGHLFGGKVTYTWNEETHECTASWKCQHTGCNETQTETVTGVYVKDFDATCTANEKGHYKATFTTVQQFEKQVTSMFDVPNTAKGHNYGTPTYTWNEDHTKCTATVTCSHCDSTITNEGTVTVENGYAVATFENEIFETQRFKLPEPTPSKNGLSGGAVAGIVIGSIVGACLITYVAMFFVWKKNEKALKFLKPSFIWINKKIYKK